MRVRKRISQGSISGVDSRVRRLFLLPQPLVNLSDLEGVDLRPVLLKVDRVLGRVRVGVLLKVLGVRFEERLLEKETERRCLRNVELRRT